ncbi:kinase-like domain-containing protein, partial [Mycena epipterygia]
DLSIIASAQAYLETTQFARKTVTLVSNVHSNFTYRLELSTSYKGRSTLVMKHARPDIPLSDSEKLSQSKERCTFEAKVLEKIKAELYCGPLTTVPELHDFDKHVHEIIMDDCRVESITLNELMLTATPSITVAREIGLALGEFLGWLHSWGAADPAMLDVFDQNKQAKVVIHYCFLAITRHIISTPTTDNLPAVALIPGEIPDSTLDAIRAIVDERIPEIYQSRETLATGDFWTGNVLVSLRPAADTEAPSLEHVYFIDWEFVQPRIAALDVGKFFSSPTRRRPRLYFSTRFWLRTARTAAQWPRACRTLRRCTWVR